MPPKKEGDDDGTCFNWSEDKYKEMRAGQLSATYQGEVHFEGQVGLTALMSRMTSDTVVFSLFTDEGDFDEAKRNCLQ